MSLNLEDPNDDIILPLEIIEEDISYSLQVISYNNLWDVENDTIKIAFEKNNNYAPTGTKSDPKIKEFFENIDLWKLDELPDIFWELTEDIKEAHIFVRFHDQPESKSYLGNDAKKVLENYFDGHSKQLPPTLFISLLPTDEVEKERFQRKCCLY